ncbi:MAG: plasmid mobilization relaxosome protein MobC [Opitutaceae bacterium]
MPRPKKTTATLASRQIIFRLTENEYAELAAVAGRAGLRVNELARRLARRGGQRVVIRTSRRHDPAFIAQIRGMGQNLNQLVHNAHIFGRVSPKVAEVCEEIRRIVLTAAEESDER